MYYNTAALFSFPDLSDSTPIGSAALQHSPITSFNTVLQRLISGCQHSGLNIIPFPTRVTQLGNALSSVQDVGYRIVLVYMQR